MTSTSPPPPLWGSRSGYPTPGTTKFFTHGVLDPQLTYNYGASQSDRTALSIPEGVALNSSPVQSLLRHSKVYLPILVAELEPGSCPTAIIG